MKTTRPQVTHALATVLVSVLVPLHMPVGKGYNDTALIAPALSELTRQRVTAEMEFLLLSPLEFSREVASVRAAIDDSAQLFKHLHIPDDYGWFRALNAGWRAAKGEFITVVRLEDRLAHPTINLKRRYLSARASCDILSSAVYPTSSPSVSFGTARKGATLRTPPSDWLVRPMDVFAWSETRRRGFARDRSLITGPNEAVRASLMWRSSLASEIGLFNASFATLADWEFLLRAGVRGRVVCWLKIALQSFMVASPLLDDAELEHKERTAAEQETAAIVDVYSRFVSLRVLIVNEVPLSGVEGSHVRMDQVVHEIVEAGHQLVYVARDTAWSYDMGKWVEQMRTLGVHVIVGDNELTSLNNLGNFEVVIAAAWYWRCGATSVPDLATAKLGVAHSSRMIVLSDDIHYVRSSQQQLVEPSCDIYTGPIKERELRDYSRADMIIAVTDEDAAKMRPYLHNERQAAACVRFVPVVAKPPPIPHDMHATFGKRSSFLYVGSHHYGNQQAVRWLLNEVLPRLRAAQPDVRLVLVGAEIWKEFARNHSGVVTHGVVSDLSLYLKRARVLLVPNLVGGSGISTKTMLALEHLIPFVTTTHGVTAVNAERTPGAFHISDEASDFARKALRVYSDLAVWKGTVSAIHAHVTNYLTTARISSAMQQTLYTAVSEQCLSPRWTANSLSARKGHRLIRFQRQQAAQVTVKAG